MTRHFLLMLMAMSGAIAPGPSPAWAQSAAESKLSQGSVSILVEPQLDDGRLVVKVAAKNLGRAPVPFGPSSMSVATPSGVAIAIYPLSRLVSDVRMAAGLSTDAIPPTAPTQGAYSAPQQNVRDGGRMDVTGFTGGSVVGGDEYIRRSRPSRKVKPTITEAQAAHQVAALKQAILQDSTLAVGQVAAGQVVTEKLKFGKKDDRTLHLRIRLAGEEHAFTIAAPKE